MDDRARDGQQLTVQGGDPRRARRLGGRRAAPDGPAPLDELEDPPRDAAGAIPYARRGRANVRREPLHQAGQHAHPIGQPRAVGRIVDVRFDDRGVNAHPPTPGHAALPRDPHHPLQQGLQRLRAIRWARRISVLASGARSQSIRQKAR